MIKNQDKIKAQIVEFACTGIESFLKQHAGITFYAFAFDCNADYAGIGLCLNTEKDFQTTLATYQNGEYGAHYQSEEDIKDLKYNTGDWEYQCFDTLSVFTEEELTEIFGEMPDDDYQTWNKFVADLLDLFTESLIAFSQTETYAKIPKTTDFIVYCIDHDEDIDEAMERLKRIQSI